eukprot:TRINITY_DN1259_c0_g1_i7.p1 TRINITY_DN1259_c0_g1~~TRINITY_DN1259_c0_g1_i7.p1  ORF type:complete len:945 (+),score=166.56 TRINITY_DN1259_c0_g1_i7:43-2877(+)
MDAHESYYRNVEEAHRAQARLQQQYAPVEYNGHAASSAPSSVSVNSVTTRGTGATFRREEGPPKLTTAHHVTRTTLTPPANNSHYSKPLQTAEARGEELISEAYQGIVAGDADYYDPPPRMYYSSQPQAPQMVPVDPYAMAASPAFMGHRAMPGMGFTAPMPFTHHMQPPQFVPQGFDPSAQMAHAHPSLAQGQHQLIHGQPQFAHGLDGQQPNIQGQPQFIRGPDGQLQLLQGQPGEGGATRVVRVVSSQGPDGQPQLLQGQPGEGGATRVVRVVSSQGPDGQPQLLQGQPGEGGVRIVRVASGRGGSVAPVSSDGAPLASPRNAPVRHDLTQPFSVVSSGTGPVPTPQLSGMPVVRSGSFRNANGEIVTVIPRSINSALTGPVTLQNVSIPTGPVVVSGSIPSAAPLQKSASNRSQQENPSAEGSSLQRTPSFRAANPGLVKSSSLRTNLGLAVVADNSTNASSANSGPTVVKSGIPGSWLTSGLSGPMTVTSSSSEQLTSSGVTGAGQSTGTLDRQLSLRSRSLAEQSLLPQAHEAGQAPRTDFNNEAKQTEKILPPENQFVKYGPLLFDTARKVSGLDPHTGPNEDPIDSLSSQFKASSVQESHHRTGASRSFQLPQQHQEQPQYQQDSYYQPSHLGSFEQKTPAGSLHRASILGDSARETADSVAEEINICMQRGGQILNLRFKSLIVVPGEVFNMRHLQVLNLSKNQLEELPASINNLQGLVALDVSSNRLSNLPPTIGDLSYLQELSVSENMLSFLPREIVRLQRLCVLAAAANKLSDIPGEIYQLRALVKLDLNGNDIRGISDAICHLSSLTDLNLSGNQLTVLPNEITMLPALRELNLSVNSINYIPNDIGRMNSLESLVLSVNLCQYLPPSIGNLVNLGELRIESNRLVELPKELGNLVNLRKLTCSGNPIQNPPQDVIRRGKAAILKYLRDMS